MSAHQPHLASATTQLPRGRGSWGSRAQALALVTGALLLELLPVQAWLLTFAGLDGLGIARAAEPPWALGIALLAFWAVARLLRQRGMAASLAASLVIGALVFALLLAISPSTYGDLPGGALGMGWVSAFGQDLANDDARLNAVFGLFVLTGYLGWRGISLGGEAVRLARVQNVFRIGMGAVILAIIGAATVRPSQRAEVVGALALLLPLFVFCGLATSALARVSYQRAIRRGDEPFDARSREWLAVALGLALLVLALALALSAVVSYSEVGSALRSLGPVGVGANNALEWVINSFAGILGFIFDRPVEALRNIFHQKDLPRITTPPARAHQPTPQIPLWLQIATTVLEVLIGALVLAAAVYGLFALLRLVLRQPRLVRGVVTEEREALDGRGLLASQLQDLLARLGRRAPREQADDLSRGSVRWIFREVLRAGAAAELARLPAETADEYARRLAGTLAAQISTMGATATADTAASLTALAEAYDAARYDDQEPSAAERGRLRTHAAQVMALLTRRARGQARE